MGQEGGSTCCMPALTKLGHHARKLFRRQTTHCMCVCVRVCVCLCVWCVCVCVHVYACRKLFRRAPTHCMCVWVFVCACICVCMYMSGGGCLGVLARGGFVGVLPAAQRVYGWLFWCAPPGCLFRCAPLGVLRLFTCAPPPPILD